MAGQGIVSTDADLIVYCALIMETVTMVTVTRVTLTIVTVTMVTGTLLTSLYEVLGPLAWVMLKRLKTLILYLALKISFEHVS